MTSEATAENPSASSSEPTRCDHVVVVAGGDAPWPQHISACAPFDAVIAADLGIDHCVELGLAVAVAVGDFDSVSAVGLATVEQAGARVVRYPTGKDASDLELALDEALQLHPERITVLGAGGGRVDHALTNLLLLTSENYVGVDVDAFVDQAKILVVRTTRTIAGAVGEPVTLLAAGVDAMGVTTQGLSYVLSDSVLPANSSLGLSNTLATPIARVSVAAGTLIVVQAERFERP